MRTEWAHDLLRAIDRPEQTWHAVNREMDSMVIHWGTLSQTLAELFRTETMPGKIAFTLVTATCAAWLVNHIVTFEYSQKKLPA